MADPEEQFEGEIIEVKPLAVYQGATYNQLVVIKLKNGPVLGFFDQHSLARKEHIGAIMRVTASILVGREGKNYLKKYDIHRVGDMNAEISGRVKKIWEERDESVTQVRGLLDCGAAIFSFSPSSEIKIGEYISFKGEGHRIDLQSLDSLSQ
jgi:hypothetical protein